MIVVILLGVLFIIALCIWQYKQVVPGTKISINHVESQFSATDLPTAMIDKKPILVLNGPISRVWTSRIIAESKTIGKMGLHVKRENGEGVDNFRITTRNYLRSLQNTNSQLEMTITNSKEIAESLGLTKIIEERTRDGRSVWLPWVSSDVYIVGLESPSRSLTRINSEWAVVIPTDGNVYVSIVHPDSEKYLPQDEHVHIWSDESLQDYPLLGEAEYKDIVVRPGVMLFIPAHWHFSIRAQMDPTPPDEDDTIPVSLGIIGYIDSPTSKLACSFLDA